MNEVNVNCPDEFAVVWLVTVVLSGCVMEAVTLPFADAPVPLTVNVVLPLVPVVGEMLATSVVALTLIPMLRVSLSPLESDTVQVAVYAPP